MAEGAHWTRGHRPVIVIGAPSGLGGCCAATAFGPKAIREAGLLERIAGRGVAVEDRGDIPVTHPGRLVGPDAVEALDEAVANCCRALREEVRTALLEGAFPLVLGGDHSLGAGSQAGVASACRALGWDGPGLIWFGAHADLEAGAAGVARHHQPMAALLGMSQAGGQDQGGLEPSLLAAFAGCIANDGGRDPSRVALVAQREVGAAERATIERLGIRLFDAAEIRRRGIDACLAEALVRVAGDDGRFSLSFDLDSLDPAIAPGVDCPTPGGLTLDEVRIALGMVADHGGLIELDIVEVNPAADRCGRTSHLAVEAATTLVAPLAASEQPSLRAAMGA